MKLVKIKLSGHEDIKNLVRITNQYDFDVDLQSGRYVVNGKSILGIFSLDLAQPIQVIIHSDACEGLIKDLSCFSL